MTGIGGSEIQPGESATCDVVFDVLTSAVAQVAKTGNLDVLNFGDDFSGDANTRRCRSHEFSAITGDSVNRSGA